MKILIAIHGSHSQPEQMQAQRDTWLKDLQGADYKFFLGRTEGYDNHAIPVWYANDAAGSVFYGSEGDIVIGDYLDGPILEGIHRTWNLNRKTEAMAKYALGNEYDHVFKCDDDTYVRPEMLLASGFEAYDYSGCTDTHYTQDLGWYRWAQGGAGYWLSRKAMEIVAENGLHVIPAEDFCVGNILAANSIHPHHDERYKPGATAVELDSPEAIEPYITLHKVSALEMRRLYSAK